MKKKLQYIGLDVHKKPINVEIADEGREDEVRSYGTITGSITAVGKLVKKLRPSGNHLEFVYEAGPCGYDICRFLKDQDLSCIVTAPSITPKISGDRIKNDG